MLALRCAALVLMAVCGDDCDGARGALSRYAGVAAEPLYQRAEQSLRAEGAPSGEEEQAL